MNDKKLAVGIVFGGQSGEHEVSIRSAASVIAAIDDSKYTIIPIGITKDGRWITSGDPMKILIDHADPEMLGSIPDELESRGYECGVKRFSHAPELKEAMHLPPPDLIQTLDVAFPVLHGPFGEDGTIQGLFEMAGIPYVGCGVLASSVAMDKILFKHILRSLQIPTPQFFEIHQVDIIQDCLHTARQAIDQLGLPVFCKPANLGSSVGITKCNDLNELMIGLEQACRFDSRIIVEAAVPNVREIEVSVLGYQDPEASIPGEIRPSREFYDYTAKYIDSGDDSSALIIPAPVDEIQIERCRELAVKIFAAIDGAGMARVDFLLNSGTGEILLNEINSIPGFTSISMYAKLWDASGIPYHELIDRLILLALERFRVRSGKAMN